MQLQAPKGMKDVTPKDSYKWQAVESLAREICASYGYYETRTPVLEHTELFLRGVGDTTDIVQKEMYTFTDKGERSVTLKPEGTAGVVRMFLENRLFSEAQPTKMYYLYCPVFRYDKPQAGRFREHHQFGVEVFGAPRASADAEVIALACTLVGRLGVEKLSVNINSIGCPECRTTYNDALKAYLRENYNSLCETCKTRFEKNPIRILDCKEERCQGIVADAPKVLDFLCEDCAAHFEELKSCLDALDIAYKVDPMIVRGLDYYTKTVFEIISTEGAYKGTVCGGGRYDNLISELGGPEMCAVGFGMGMERLLLVAESFRQIPAPRPLDVYVAAVGEAARAQGLRFAAQLRKAGVSAEFDHVGRSFKAQFKYADKLGARRVAILGEDELLRGVVKLKDMAGGGERELPLEDAAGIINVIAVNETF
ncbi:MAG TPA: histidine--tRNA ligase [Clostridia bacterium]|nr:histidine--tRNA ligase [Clostridia bacterium]